MKSFASRKRTSSPKNNCLSPSFANSVFSFTGPVLAKTFAIFFGKDFATCGFSFRELLFAKTFAKNTTFTINSTTFAQEPSVQDLLVDTSADAVELVSSALWDGQGFVVLFMELSDLRTYVSASGWLHSTPSMVQVQNHAKPTRKR